jgi:hypothetical protein
VTPQPDDDLVPVSVRLGEVVPPEDPEDWTRPLTWVAAIGMLAGPVVAFAWFAMAPPTSSEPVPATFLVAAVLAGGAAVTGATQQGAARAATATLGAGLFGALVVVILGVAMAGERQVAAASPTLAHAFAAAVAGVVGAIGAAAVAALLASRRAGLGRSIVTASVAIAVAIVVLLVLRPSPPASAAAGDSATCTTRLAGATIAVRYPATWATGDPDGVHYCNWFGDAAIVDDPASASIVLGAAGGGPEPPSPDDVSRDDASVDGYPAIRIEREREEDDGSMTRSVTYDIALGEGGGGPIIVAFTDSGRPGPFEENVRVLERMMELLEITLAP